MKYLVLKWNKEKYWFELDECSYVNRQIVLDEHNEIHISCLEDYLAEGPIYEEDLEGDISNLTEQEFEYVWKSSLKKYENKWKKNKERYPIGQYVHGVNSYSYPQGTVIKGKDFIAIYKGNDEFCINKSVRYKVESYDDTNMWLVVS